MRIKNAELHFGEATSFNLSLMGVAPVHVLLLIAPAAPLARLINAGGIPAIRAT